MRKIECDRCGTQQQARDLPMPIARQGAGIQLAAPLPDGWRRITIPTEEDGTSKQELCPDCVIAAAEFLHGAAVKPVAAEANPETRPDTGDAIAELAQAIRLTREYVGEELLPAVEGWSWYDALRRHAPHELPNA